MTFVLNEKKQNTEIYGIAIARVGGFTVRNGVRVSGWARHIRLRFNDVIIHPSGSKRHGRFIAVLF